MTNFAEHVRRGMRVVALLIPMSAIASGCAIDFPLKVVRTDVPHRNRSPEKIVVLMGDSKPPCAYDEFGQIGPSSHTYSLPAEDVIQAVRQRAAEAGADGVLNLHEGGVGTIGEGSWQGTLYVCRD